ncbi:MAG: DUF4440 domain-containing protein [Candidatus Omnitrophota bacterium]|jgi:ketosteroid isomerase-like protein|nr:MAG: DUF4440 domain-containing protein [Candidatus Omnitrophota bacterium]
MKRWLTPTVLNGILLCCFVFGHSRAIDAQAQAPAAETSAVKKETTTDRSSPQKEKELKIEQAVRETMNRFRDLYVKKDLEGLMALFSDEEDVFIYGSGVDEKRIGPAAVRTQFERDFAQVDSVSVHYDWQKVIMAGNAAIFVADMTMQYTVNGEKATLSGRFTYILQQQNDRWRIKVGHFSIPTPSQDEGQSFPRKNK